MFLADENFPKPSTLLLRQAGYAVTSIQENCPGVSDQTLVDLALENNLIILTFDRDYGEIMFRYGVAKKPGVIYFRDKGSDPEAAGRLLLKLLLFHQMKFENSFTVAEQTNVRQRFY